MGQDLTPQAHKELDAYIDRLWLHVKDEVHEHEDQRTAHWRHKKRKTSAFDYNKQVNVTPELALLASRRIEGMRLMCGTDLLVSPWWGHGLSEGGIYVEQTDDKPPIFGTVILAGKNVRDVGLGDNILFTRWAGDTVDIYPAGQGDFVRLLVIGLPDVESVIATDALPVTREEANARTEHLLAELDRLQSV